MKVICITLYIDAEYDSGMSARVLTHVSPCSDMTHVTCQRTVDITHNCICLVHYYWIVKF